MNLLFRKGDESTNRFLDIVLAVIGIVGLAFLGFKLATLFVDQDLKNAKAFVNDVTAKIDALENGENNTFALRGPQGWVLVAWNRDVPIGRYNKPEKCFDKNCLCLCKDSPLHCQEVGFCRDIDRNVSVVSGFSYESLVPSSRPTGNKFGKKFYDDTYLKTINSSCFYLSPFLLPITIEKSLPTVTLRYYYPSSHINEETASSYSKELYSQLASCHFYESFRKISS